MLTLYIPTHDAEVFNALPRETLQAVHARFRAVAAMDAVKGKPGRALEVATMHAGLLGVTVSRVRMLASHYRSQGWRALLPKGAAGVSKTSTLPPAFCKWWRDEVVGKGKGGKTVKACYDWLIAKWNEERVLKPAQTVFVGYDETPEAAAGTHIPAGWSESNLCDKKKIPSDAELTLTRRGVGAYRAYGAQVLTDRKSQEVGARLEMDDYHWNQHVVFHMGGANVQRVKVLQLGIMDVRSGCVPSVYLHPAYTRGDGATDGIKQDHTLLLLAAHLFNHGYLPGKTQIAVEKGTAGLHAKHREAFACFAPGLEFDDAGSRERFQAQGWGGNSRTNANKKAHLESWHHALTNVEASGPASSGANYAEQPEHVAGLLREIDFCLRKVTTAGQLELLRLGALEFRAFVPWAKSLIERLNNRRNHELQGFVKDLCYRTSPESLEWLTAQELLALSEPSRLALADGIAQSPAVFTANMKQSPAQVFNAGRGALTRLSGMQACHLASSVLGAGFMSRVVRSRRLDRAYFSVSESKLTFLPEPIIFESRILDVRGEWREVPAGADVEIVFNPLDDGFPRKCFVRDEKGGFMGMAMEAERIDANDREELLDAMCHKAARDAERTQAVRDSFAPERAAVIATKKHNRQVLAGEPVTAAEKQAARRSRNEAKAARASLVDAPKFTPKNTHANTDRKTTTETTIEALR